MCCRLVYVLSPCICAVTLYMCCHLVYVQSPFPSVVVVVVELPLSPEDNPQKRNSRLAALHRAPWRHPMVVKLPQAPEDDPQKSYNCA